jgi:nitrogenase molybdenum-cofactor synthesis protein NifE
VDDANPLELRELLAVQKADLLVAGVKERFLAYKLGIAFCDFNHDRTTSFEGYDGLINFARELDASLNSPVWKLPLRRSSPIAGSRGSEIEKAIEKAAEGGVQADV